MYLFVDFLETYFSSIAGTRDVLQEKHVGVFFGGAPQKSCLIHHYRNRTHAEDFVTISSPTIFTVVPARL